MKTNKQELERELKDLNRVMREEIILGNNRAVKRLRGWVEFIKIEIKEA